MKGTYTIGKRLLAMLLCVAMVAAYLPGMALPAKAAISEVDKVVDPSTINGWEQYFGPDAITTEYTGGIWTDKSVFGNFDSYLQAIGVSQLQGPTTAITSQVRDMLNTDPENFLVALSAIAANQQITGYTTTPTDTMLVLDVSQSMDNQDYVPGMVSAANATIKTLMDGNPNNRVGVVLFSGSNSQDSNQGTASATVLLPLDHYTATNNAGTFLRCNGSDETSVYIATGVENGDGDTMNSDTGKTTNGGTYTQNGLYKAWGEFSRLTAADTVIPEGQPQAGTKRIPALVLMSDGQPTVGDTTYYDVGNSTLGDGTTPSQTNGDRLSFLTQLTAAWVKAKIANKYSIKNEEVRFYTLGLNTSTNRYATDTLNPATSTNTRLANYWDSFVSATPNWWGQVTVRNGNNDSYTIYKNDDGMITSAAQRVYPTQYFSASDTEKLAEAFATIADELTTGIPYVTLVSDGEANLDGYVTFEDQLGALMEVKDIKGLVMGDRVFTGAELAKSMNEGDLGQTVNPTDYGNEFVRTVKERLGITDTSVAQRLIQNAYQAGQLSYTSATEYSNYIGWYADAQGNYVGFWQESDGYGTEAAPEGAAYINKSYGYLGAESSEEGASDMMHVVVMVHTEIATGDQSIIYKIPASLIPTVLYHVELEGTDTSNPKSITREDAFPLQLLAEVGLRSDINAVNLEKKVAEYVDNGGHAHKNADGTYSFYTNRWGYGHGEDVNYDEPLTHVVAQSHFHPALDNERYYHVSDTLIYSDDAGTVYNGATAPSGDGYYYIRNYYKIENGTPKLTTEYVPLAEVSVAKAEQGSDGWYVPAGTPHQLARFATTKTPNATGTLVYSWNPVVLHDAAGYNSYAFLGNNGKLTVAPAQGIALTKTVAELSEDVEAPTEFTFHVTLSQTVADPAVTDTDGNPIDAEKWSVSGNVITVKLSADETVVITGIPTGTTYTVEEEVTAYYAASSANASGTVAAYTVNNVDFVNTARGYGSLVVGKNVNYPQGFVPGSAHNSREFTIVVEFTGDVADIVAPAGAVRSGNAYTLKLKDGESVTFTNIPEGAVYTVSEGAAPAGYAFQELRYTDETRTIAAHDLDEAEVVNSYSLQPVSPNVKVQGSKTLVTNESNWGGETFTVELFRIDDFADQDPVSTGLTATVSESNKDYEIDLSSIVFTTAGTYNFRAVEVIPTDRNENIAYDRTYGLFSITVGDADADGNLEIQSVNAYQSTGVTGSAADGWVIEKDFTNVVTTDRIYLDIQKNVVDVDDNTPVNEHLGDITFGLFADMNAGTAPAYYMLTDTAGKATIMVPVTQQIISQASGSLVYYLREIAPAPENRVVGMHYDESWLYAIEISWDAQNNTAVVRYAPIVNGTVGTYETYVDGTTVFNHTNTYESGVKVALGLSGEKTLNGGNDLGGREFSFSLYKSTAAFVQGELIETVKNNGNAIAFADVSFTAPGVYYMVARENASDLDGITVDGAVYHITVEVEKFVDTDGTSRLRLVTGYPSVVKYGTSTNVGADGLDFNNIYTITGREDVTITGHKTLAGRELIAGEFEFGLYEGGQLVASAKNLTNGNFSFPTITYTPADIGTHTYTVKEIVPTDRLGGVTYDDAEFTVVVKVEDDGKGGMTVTKMVNNDENGSIEFVNSYATQPIDVTLTGSKTLYNQDTSSYITLNGGEFTFFLHKADENFIPQSQLAVPAVTNGAGGTISILLEDLEAGDYYYILREDLGNANGMHYDTSVFNIRVLVTDSGDGTLRSMVTIQESGNGPSVIAFGNTYSPDPVEHAISGNKVLIGRDNVPIADGEFSFELYDAENNLLETVSNEADGSFLFSAIEYEKSGTYTYTVKEHIPTGYVNNAYKGVIYDTDSYTVTVVVTDNPETGALEAVATYPDGGLTITNTYEGKATSVDIQGEKILTGRQWKENESYTFDLYDINNNHVGTAHSKAQNIGGETRYLFVFENIPLDEAKTYTFAVRERIPAGEHYGIDYSDLTYQVQITVTDNGTGDLVAGAPVITLNDQPVQAMVFTNTYSVTATTATIRAIKRLEGKSLTAGMFEFELYDKNGQFVERVSNKADGAVNFAPIEYIEAGIYEYTVKEVIPTGAVNNVYQGITYDPAVHQVTVEVVDNGDGTLTATTIYADGSVQFTNSYAITESVKVDISGTKILTGKDITDELFTFRLFDENGVQVGGDVTNIGNSFLFADVELTEAKTYIFTVKEVIPSAAINTVYKGIDYDERVYTAYVTARDNGVGGLTASAVTYSVGGVDSAHMEFVNRYDVSDTQLVLEGTKVLTGRDIVDGEFFFDVYEGTEKVTEGTNDGNTIVFKPIEYTAAGDHTYKVIERIPDGTVNNVYKGVTYDTREYTVTVKVKDNGDGTLTATPAYVNGAILFENSYSVTPTYRDIEGMKVLDGKDIAQNVFTFQLLDEAKQFLAETTTDSFGRFVFTNVELKEAKTYTFFVKEVIPAEAVETVLDGMDYDEREYKITIKVTDNGDGTLTAAAPVYWLNEAPAAMEFKNVYSITGTTHVDIPGEKKLTGKPMVAGDFTFELYKGDERIASVTNTAEGKFLFDDVTLTELGEHIFTVVEKNTGIVGMDYDESVYTVKVIVVDNNVGGLKVESTQITRNDEPAELVFENVYTPADLIVDLGIQKTVQSLAEQTIGPEGFRFQLVDETGKQLAVAESDKQGNAKFSLAFQAEDIGRTFKGVISEVNTRRTGVVYSLNKYAVEITITQASSGELIPVIKVDGKETETVNVAFVNVYEPAVTPVTGDNFFSTLFISLMILSSFGLVAVMVCKKREEETVQ